MSRGWTEWERHAVELLDTLEDPAPPRGCNAHWADGGRCGRAVIKVEPGPFSMRRLCKFHAPLYRKHDIMRRRILAISAQEATI